MSEKRDNTFTLSKQDPAKVKFGNDYTGSAIIDGQEYWLNAKVVTSKEGKKFFSGTLKLKQPKYGE